MKEYVARQVTNVARVVGYLSGAVIPIIIGKGLSYLVTSNFSDESFFGEHVSNGIGVLTAIGANYALAREHGGDLMRLGSDLAGDLAEEFLGIRKS